jgi:hypothetical protein
MLIATIGIALVAYSASFTAKNFVIVALLSQLEF